MPRRVLRYFQSPAYTEAEWSSRNPYLNKGEVGYLISGTEVVGMKVGPGRWNDLPLLTDIYPFADTVTNYIGDVPASVHNMRVTEILKLMLSPVPVPQVTSAGNNAGSPGHLQTKIMEIGQILTGSIQVIFSLTHPSSLISPNPINITAGGVFSNEGDHPNSSPVTLNVASPVNPSATYTVTIEIRLKHLKGITDPYYTYIKWFPRIMWLSSPIDNFPTGASFMSQSGISNIVTDTLDNTYNFTGNGYSWVAVPAFMVTPDMCFSDVTSGCVRSLYAMQNMGNLLINNGVGTYSYTMYRSVNLITVPTKMNIKS